MKKLAIVLLLVVAACQRKVVVATAPSSNDPGGATPREAVTRFMAAAKAQDLQAFANIWGSSAGPARGTMAAEELEKREIILLCYLKHDSYRVVSETPAENQERVFSVESRYQDLTRSANYFVTSGPGNRWYVRQVEIVKLNDICQRR